MCLQAYHKSSTFTDYLGNNALTLSVVLKLFKRKVMPDRLTLLSFTDIRNYLVVSLLTFVSLQNQEKLYLFLVPNRILTTLPMYGLISSNIQATVIRIHFLLTMSIHCCIRVTRTQKINILKGSAS